MTKTVKASNEQEMGNAAAEVVVEETKQPSSSPPSVKFRAEVKIIEESEHSCNRARIYEEEEHKNPLREPCVFLIIVLFMAWTSTTTAIFREAANEDLSSSSEPELIKGTRCFRSAKEIQDAVDEYVRDDGIGWRWIEEWCVDAIEDFSHLFSVLRNAEMEHFNNDISGWNMHSAKHVQFMFLGTQSFQRDLSTWDMTQVIDASYMFASSNFSGDLSRWEMGNVRNMSGMFYRANAFNSNIAGWNVSQVKDMSSMFEEATAFDQDLSTWDVSTVNSLAYMFYGSSLRQNLCDWAKRIPNHGNFTDMFKRTQCITEKDPVHFRSDDTEIPPEPFCSWCNGRHR